MSGAITGKTIAAFWARVEMGTRLRCLGNTLWESRGLAPVAEVVTVTKPGKTSIRTTAINGTHFWLTPPRRVRDVVALTEDTITYRIGDTEHTATWSIER